MIVNFIFSFDKKKEYNWYSITRTAHILDVKLIHIVLNDLM